MTAQEAIKDIVESGIELGAGDYIGIESLRTAVKALEKQIPKKPKHTHEEYPKHKWKKNNDGSIDEYAWESDIHSGPMCERCGKMPCSFCTPDYDEEKCIVNKYFCPDCNNEIDKYNSPNGCKFCLQAVDWSDD